MREALIHILIYDPLYWRSILKIYFLELQIFHSMRLILALVVLL